MTCSEIKIVLMLNVLFNVFEFILHQSFFSLGKLSEKKNKLIKP